LKELINMHSELQGGGGDLANDTVTIVGGALDFQAKVAQDSMTPISEVFMLPIEAKLDYATLAEVVKKGHSRVPVYEMRELGGQKVRKILGIMLVKQVWPYWYDTRFCY
jgi:metal transporter CNNM